MKLQDLRKMDKDDFLGLIGLETKHSVANRLFGTLGVLGIGVLVGAGVALLLAPKGGNEMRHDLHKKLHCGCKGNAGSKDGAASTSETSDYDV